MTLDQFHVGDTFWMHGPLRPVPLGEPFGELGPVAYRVTDVGSRVVVAARLDGVISTLDHGNLTQQHVSFVEDDSWLNGPPYAISEFVFDEYDQERCYPSVDACKGAYA